MEIITDYPPNYKVVLAAFPGASRKGVIFTYGDRIYNPAGNKISHALIAHETVHSERQGGEPDFWWGQYIASTQFRYREELLAHRAEYNTFYKYGRNQRRIALNQIAQRLSGRLYGKMVSLKEAKREIRHG